MRLAEFKAWFEGYTENIDTTPSAKQWDRIKEQVGKVDGTPLTRDVFVERYVPLNIPFRAREYWTSLNVGSPGNMGAAAVGKFSAEGLSNSACDLDNQTHVWNVQEAMRDLGRAEARA